MKTVYVIEYRRPGHSWRVDDEPMLYEFMSVAEAAAKGSDFKDLETRVVPKEVR